tara:strand:+ start:1845 stop:2819 length:975 start_codon:yes stop_codon:yes gene_type:complete
MGYGDYIHWTAIIRDLCKEVNSIDRNDVHNYIVNLCRKVKNQNINVDYGITNLKKSSNNHNFKVLAEIKWKGNIFNHEQAKVIFRNNPNVTNDDSYPNIIYLTIKSDGYLLRDHKQKIIKLFDHQHVVDTYSKNIGLEAYNKKGCFYFTDEELKKVKDNLPNKKFILIEPQNHKNLESRVLSFDFMQKIVDTLKANNDIEVVQISPSKFADKESKFLNNCIVFKDVFTFREAVLFGKHAEFAIVPHGGMSIGLASVETKVIAIYPCIHKVPMTTYDSEIAFEISDGNHYLCFDSVCRKCSDLRDKFNKNNFENIVDKANQILRD